MLISSQGWPDRRSLSSSDEIADLWIEDGRIIAAPQGRQPDQTHDVAGKIVMAGAIDIHSHIAGGNVNTARLLLPEMHRAGRAPTLPLATSKWSTFETGNIYASMGFTTVVEPAVAPHQGVAGASRAFGHSNHRQSHADHSRQR